MCGGGGGGGVWECDCLWADALNSEHSGFSSGAYCKMFQQNFDLGVDYVILLPQNKPAVATVGAIRIMSSKFASA